MIKCRFCESTNCEKNGHRYNKKGTYQRYACNQCNRSFIVDNGFLHKGFKDKIITSCLDLYFNGLSLRKISNHLYSCYSINVSYGTVYKWIIEYSERISAAISGYVVNSSKNIHADEIMISIGGEWHWFWSVLCEDNRMLTSSIITKTRDIQYARKLFEETKQHLPERPRNIITDGLPAYKRAVSKAFWRSEKSYSGVKHVRLIKFIDKVNNNVMERVNGTMKDKIKIMRGFKSVEGANAIMSGFMIYYNFVRPHMGLDFATPAETAGINLNLGTNRWMSLINLTANSSKVSNMLSVNQHEGPFTVKVFKNGVEINPKKLGMKSEFSNYRRAKEFAEFYKQVYPNYDFEIE
jgi:transposase-like protein